MRLLGLAAVAALILSAATARRAEAMTPINPTALPAARATSDDMMIQVRGGGGHGGGFHGGGFHGGGHFGGFHGGGFHGGFHGGGFHYGGWGGYHRHWGYRPFYGYRHFHRRFYGGYYPYYYPRPCRVIWTYYGPRRICHWHRWHYPYRYW
jgi:hypothetical protein